MKSTENSVWDGRIVTRDDVSQELFDNWAREIGNPDPSDDPYSDAPSGLFRGVGLALVVSLVLWLAIMALVVVVI